jgi:hypothetical protein
MADTLIPKPAASRRIDERDFAADCLAELERLRKTGESVEIVKDGQIVAFELGGSRGVLAYVDPNDTLDDLLTEEDIEAWYAEDEDDPIGR